VACVEEIGPMERTLPAQIATLEDWASRSKDGGGGMELVTAVLLLATAPKSRVSCWMLIREGTDHRERIEIPDEALDRHTRRGLKMGRSHEHFFDEAQKLIDPEEAARSRGYDSVDEELRALEAGAEQHARRLQSEGPEGLPQNPWRRDEPAPDPQLRLSSDDQGANE
jgi:replication-associated recombination protein RarA